MNILVIGGLGFIGSYLCKRLDQHFDNYDIYDTMEFNGFVSCQTALKRRGMFNNATIIKKEDLGKKEYDFVFHLGSFAGVRDDRPETMFFVNNNLELLKLLAVVNFKKIIYISSSSVLGDKKSAYSMSKEIAEGIIKTLDNWLIVRPFTVYDKDALARSDMFMYKVLTSKHIKINGNPETIIRRFTYVEDVIDCIIENYDIPGNETINAMGVKEYKLIDVLYLFGVTFSPGKPDYRDFSSQTFNNKDIIYDCTTSIEKIKEELSC